MRQCFPTVTEARHKLYFCISRAVAILVLSFLLGMGYNSASDYPLPLWGWRGEDPAKGVATASNDMFLAADDDEEISGNGITYVQPEQARKWYDSEKAVFLDAREEEEFKKGHVPRAQRLDPKQFRNGKPNLLDYLPIDQFYIIYCESSRECGAAEIVAEQMQIYGYKEVQVLREGWEVWKRNGWPEETEGSKPLSEGEKR